MNGVARFQAGEITLPSHNITIKDAFSEIEKQTGMSVDYDESVINLNKQVNALSLIHISP